MKRELDQTIFQIDITNAMMHYEKLRLEGVANNYPIKTYPLFNVLDLDGILINSNAINYIVALALYYSKYMDVSIKYQGIYIFLKTQNDEKNQVILRKAIRAFNNKKSGAINYPKESRALEELINLKRIENHKKLDGKSLSSKEKAEQKKYREMTNNQSFLKLINNYYMGVTDPEEIETITELLCSITYINELRIDQINNYIDKRYPYLKKHFEQLNNSIDNSFQDERESIYNSYDDQEALAKIDEITKWFTNVPKDSQDKFLDFYQNLALEQNPKGKNPKKRYDK